MVAPAKFLVFCAKLKACKSPFDREVLYASLQRVVKLPRNMHYYVRCTGMEGPAYDAHTTLARGIDYSLARGIDYSREEKNDFYLLEGLWVWLCAEGRPETWLRWHEEIFNSLYRHGPSPNYGVSSKDFFDAKLAR